MGLKRMFGKRKIILLALVGIMAVFGAWFLYRSRSSFDVRVVCDTRLDIHACANMEKEIAAMFGACGSAAELYNSLRQEHPCLSSLRIRYHRPHQATILLNVQKPVLMVNNRWVIVANGSACSPDMFEKQLIESLFSCRIAKDTLNQDDAAAMAVWAQRIPDRIKIAYDCIWEDRTHIILREKDRNLFTVRATSQTDFDETLVATVERLKNFLIGREARDPRKKKNKGWNIDVRFAHQLVLSVTEGVRT